QFHEPNCTALILLPALSPSPKVRGTHPDCSIVLHFQEQEVECLERIHSESQTPALPGQEGCPTEWDGVSCWPALPLGQSRAVACPDILNVFKKSKGLIQRNCTEWGWSLPSPPYHSACQLETLSNNDTEAKARHFVTMKLLYTCGYSTSMAALLLAIIIFSCFRKLHCTRNSIHIHFFTSFILRGTAVFIKDSVLFSDESIDHCTMSTVNPKSQPGNGAGTATGAPWEGVGGTWGGFVTAKRRERLDHPWLCPVLAGVPMVTVGVWVLTRLQYDNHGCWDDYSSLYWWVIKAPILLAIFVNFLIFLNITRMLAQKIRCPDLSKTHKQQYMRLTKSTLLLIPLFGVHYVVFALFPRHVGVDVRLYFELVLGSYQGFLVALLYCFLNGEVQAEIRRNWGKWQRSMESNVFNLATQDFTA
ncbi:VIPR1 protein, partial [Pomatorhinus ruficollis]|nr:VIPR1 protein [Pomatorhinus ruficollis]